MRLLSLDLGHNVGYAIWRVGLDKPLLPGWLYNLEENWIQYVESGTWTMKKRDSLGDEYCEFYELIHEIVNENDIDMVTYECIEFIKYVYAAQVQFGFEAIVSLLASQHGIGVVPQGVTKIKKFICGDGRASKQMVVDRALEILYENTIVKISITDNEADAIACGLLTIQELKAEHEP